MDGQIIAILIAAVFAILIYVSLVRYVFRIDTQIQNQAKMINLLAHLLKTNGVSQEDIDNLVFKKKK